MGDTEKACFSPCLKTVVPPVIFPTILKLNLIFSACSQSTINLLNVDPLDANKIFYISGIQDVELDEYSIGDINGENINDFIVGKSSDYNNFLYDSVIYGLYGWAGASWNFFLPRKYESRHVD